jgi:rSAM/selenodomain-associated transferase 1
VVFAKAPEPGRVKTRLCPPLSPEAAANLQGACLLDFWDRLDQLSVHRVVCYDPPHSLGLFRDFLGAEADLLEQPAGGLGDRLFGAFEVLLGRFGPVVAVGADSPDLPLNLIQEAILRLSKGTEDVALGPAEDGGYTLIGLCALHRELFEGIPWSTGSVFSITVERCVAAGLRVLTLSPWYDVDDAPSLERLRESVRRRPDELPRLYRLFEEVHGS